MKKLLIVTERFYPEEFLVNDLVSTIEEQFDVTVLTQQPSYPFDKLFDGYDNKRISQDRFNFSEVIRIKTVLGYKRSVLKKLFNYLSFAIRTYIYLLFNGKKFDSVFFYHTGPATMAHSSFVMKKLYRKKCVIWTQDVWPDAIYAYGFKKNKILDYFLLSYLRLLYKNFQSVYVTSKGFIEVIKQYYDGTVEYVPQWNMVNLNTTPVNTELEKIFFTFAGNIGTVQNLDNVVKGFALAVEQNSSIHLNIVGDGSYKDTLESLVNEKKIKNILFTGRIPMAEMNKWFNKSQVLIISLKNDTSLAETIPAKFQTYLNAARPLLIIARGEISNIVKNNDLGLTTDPEDLNSIAEGFIRFANNKSLIKKLSGSTLDYYNREYNKDVLVKKLISLLV